MKENTTANIRILAKRFMFNLLGSVIGTVHARPTAARAGGTRAGGPGYCVDWDVPEL